MSSSKIETRNLSPQVFSGVAQEESVQNINNDVNSLINTINGLVDTVNNLKLTVDALTSSTLNVDNPYEWSEIKSGNSNSPITIYGRGMAIVGPSRYALSTSISVDGSTATVTEGVGTYYFNNEITMDITNSNYTYGYIVYLK